MPKRKELVLVVDVETAGNLAAPLVYDYGVAVVERTTGKILESYSFILREIFVEQPELMQSAFYANKLPQYHRGIQEGIFQVVKFWTAWKVTRNLIEKYGIKKVYAYKADFDKRALDNTFAKLSERGKNWMPRGVKWGCIWHMSCQTILSQKTYRKFATKHGLVTPKGNLSTTAEAAYAYITKTPDYEEDHTGLADVKIEAEILAHVLRQKKKMRENLNPRAWTIPQQRSLPTLF